VDYRIYACKENKQEKWISTFMLAMTNNQEKGEKRMTQENYDILRFIEQGKACYISTENTEGSIMQVYLRENEVEKNQVLSWVYELANGMERFYKCNIRSGYQYINPFCMMIDMNGHLHLLDMDSSENRESYKRANREDVRELFSPPESWGRQISDEQSDIYSFGKLVQYILSRVCLDKDMSGSIKHKLKKIIERSIYPLEKKSYLEFSTLKKEVSKYRKFESVPYQNRIGQEPICSNINQVGTNQSQNNMSSQVSGNQRQNNISNQPSSNQRQNNNLNQNSQNSSNNPYQYDSPLKTNKSKTRVIILSIMAFVIGIAVVLKMTMPDLFLNEKSAKTSDTSNIKGGKNRTDKATDNEINNDKAKDKKSDKDKKADKEKKKDKEKKTTAPKTGEDYHKLALKYEEAGNVDKAIEYYAEELSISFDLTENKKSQLYKNLIVYCKQENRIDMAIGYGKVAASEFLNTIYCAEFKFLYIKCLFEGKDINKEAICAVINESIILAPDILTQPNFQDILEENGFHIEGDRATVI
jgi:tetratricopeptide (TPR) repeat protein